MSRRRLTRDAVAALAALPVAYAATAGARFSARSGRLHGQGADLWPGVPAQPASVELAAAVALDTLFTLPLRPLGSMGSLHHYRVSDAELDDAIDFYGAQGWLQAPSEYFRPPPTPSEWTESPAPAGKDQSLLRFPSAWSPRPGEPGAARWSTARKNTAVAVRLLRHPGPPRPWLIAVHGAGLGTDLDAAFLGMRRLHRRTGVNIALPVLPMHGPRRDGFSSEHLFVSNVYPVNNVLGFGQAASDIRQLYRWLVEVEGAPGVGLFGLSLGSVVAALVTSTEPDLACAIAVVPSTDFVTPIVEMVPWGRQRRSAHFAVHDERALAAQRIVSPLSHPSLLPAQRCFVVAGVGDQVASPAGAAMLRDHWGGCDTLWRPRGHLTADRAPRYTEHLAAIVEGVGLGEKGRP